MVKILNLNQVGFENGLDHNIIIEEIMHKILIEILILDITLPVLLTNFLPYA
jgi:hypothetical protein